MPPLPLTTIALRGDVAAALSEVPALPGVGQILGPEGRSLLIGRPANLRRWAATHLGARRPARKGARPPTDLSPVAAAVGCVLTTSAFHQRLVFERLMSGHVPLAARRDLKTPAYLHLDPAERFPRLTVRPLRTVAADLFGPFRDRRAAERARASLHKLFPLRPCDYVFEPDPALVLGLGCVYAQVRTCSAPCLVRIAEEAYRGLAREVASFLARPAARPEASGEWLPPWVSAAETGLGLVADRAKAGIELYPVREGAVLEEHSVIANPEELASAVQRLAWPDPDAPRDDRPWLSAWLHTSRRSGAFLVVEDREDAVTLEVRIREALGFDAARG